MPEQYESWMNPMWPVMAWARGMSAWHSSMSMTLDVARGVSRYTSDFARSYWTSLGYWTEREMTLAGQRSPLEMGIEYTKLGGMNLELALHALLGVQGMMGKLGELERERFVQAIVTSMLGGEGEDVADYAERQAAVARMVASDYPEAIQAIVPEYGFHFEQYEEGAFAETERFSLYRVKPTDPAVKVDEHRKPLIIIPPYVLGANILAFLPGEQRSYAHAYANQGIPTYIRIMKDIHANEAVQVMDGDDDTRDTKLFCTKVREAHGLPVTLNGYCQGGFSSLCNILSGELDGLVDTLITCVSPMDGTRSVGLNGFLGKLPPRFNDLMYGTKRLANGNEVADGRLMGWVYKLKAIDAENPYSAYLRDLFMFAAQGKKEMKLNKSAVAINYWLANERTDLPLPITKMSFASYNQPITDDGVLPVKILGRKLQLDRIVAKDINWLICYGEKDDLVEKECALAPTDFVEAEATAFPRGHVAIATSWSHPESKFALHKRYGSGANAPRGPVRYQLDIEEDLLSHND